MQHSAPISLHIMLMKKTTAFLRHTSLLIFSLLSLLFFNQAVLADTLAETREILFMCSSSEPDCEQGEIAKKATALQTPAAIYEFVRNTHEYALYHGSRSNTINTYFGKRGSDVDIASVLIAMYRSQNIPARYAKATVSAPADEVSNWLGVKNNQLAAAIMNDQGIQNVNLTNNNVPVIEFEHVWVQVQVPYSDYRGAFTSTVNCTTTPNQCQWVDIDPSWKLRKFHNQNINVYGVVNFDYDRYYNAIKNDDKEYRDKGPLEIYEQEILKWLNTNHPGKTLEDVADPGVIIEAKDGLLPASLPYQVISSISYYDSIVDHDAANDIDWAKFLVIRYDLGLFSFTGGVVPPFSLSPSSSPIALADLSTKRITLSYFEGNQVPGDVFEHHQMTVRLEGEVIHTPIKVAWQNDQADYLGRKFNVTFELDGAPSTTGGQKNVISTNYNSLEFGGYYVIGTGGDTSNWSQVHRAADKLLLANNTYPIINDTNDVPYVDANKNGQIDNSEIRLLDDPIAQDAITGGLLNVAMSQYYTRFVENTRRLDHLNHILTPIEGFVGIVSSTYDVDYLNDTAFSIMPGGLLIDMKGVGFNGAWLNNAAAEYANQHFELVGHEASSLEHEIWQELTGYDAVSTVRGVQMAVANGATVLQLTDGSNATLDNMYSAMEFSENVPSSFSVSTQDIYSTRPITWSHPTTTGTECFETGTECFDMLKRYPNNSNDLRNAKLTYSNDNWHGNVSAISSCEQAIRNFIAQSGGNTILSPGTICGYGYSSTTANQLLSDFENYSIDFFNIGDNGKYDYLDQSQGFALSEFVFLDLLSNAELHSTTLVQQIRNRLIFGGAFENGNTASWEYVIPSRKVNTGFNLFSVYIEKIYDETQAELSSQSYSISNDSFTAGGGYVDGNITLTQSDVADTSTTGGAVIQPEFDNEVFTDENLVAVTNNDLIRTPSTADPVSTVTGNMYHDETDFTIKGRGLDYAFTRSYNSGSGRVDKDGPLGYGWTHSYNMSLRANDYAKCPDCTSTQDDRNDNNIPSSISYVDERGGEHTYILNADSSATRLVAENPPGEFDSLLLNSPSSGLHTLKFRNGVQYVFEEVGAASLLTTKDAVARLKYIEDPYSNRLTLTYDTSGRLENVRDNLGISGRTGLTFTYVGSATRIQTVHDWTSRTWTFNYDASGNLDSVRNPLLQTKNYTYHTGTHLLNEVIHPQERNSQKNQMAFSYYRNNKAFNYQNTLGHTETLDYDLYRQRTRVTDPRGFVREYFYDAENGALTTLKEPDGAILQFENNADGLRYTKRDGLGYLTKYSYQASRTINASASDNNGLVSREIDALDQNVDYDYGIYDQPTTVKDKRDNVTTRTYYSSTNTSTDAVAGKVQEVRATLNNTTNVLLASYRYYADINNKNFGQLKQKIEYIDHANSNRKRITDYVYASNGINLQSITVSGATIGGPITKSFTYTPYGQVETETVQRRTSATDSTLISLTTTYAYDLLNRLERVTTPRGDIQETIYDDNGLVLKQRVYYKTTTPRPNCDAPNGGYVLCTYTDNTYDAVDRLIQTKDILGNVTTFDYDESGNMISHTDANGHTTSYEYDGMGRRTAVTDANGYRTEFSYDLAGRLVATKDANGNVTTNTYDALGRLTHVTSPENRVTQTQYDANGNATHILDANALANPAHPRNNQNATLYREYDELNRVILERDALNGDTRYTYDLLGNITSVTDAEGQVTRFVYDDLGRLTETVDPVIEANGDKTDRVLLYDEIGNVLITEDRSGRQRRHTYDVLNRLIRTDYLQDNTFNQWDYDDFGDLVAVSNDEVTYSYQYTARHEMESKTDNRLNKTLQWSYDPVGNIQTKTDYQGDITTYQYDSTNRLVALRSPAYLNVSYHYDGAGRLIDRILSNGVKNYYFYDKDNRLISLINSRGDYFGNYSTGYYLFDKLDYTYDQVGNITVISDGLHHKTTTYDYDALYRLKSVDDSRDNDADRAYSYDKVGNRQSETKNGTTYYYCYDVSDCNQRPTGNRLINIRTGSITGPIYRQFTYDDNGRILTKQDGQGTSLYSISYNGKGRAKTINGSTFDYDPNDYRIRKGSQLHHLEGEHLEASYSTNGTLDTKYLRGVVIDEIVNSYTYHSANPNDSTNYTYLHDHLNSVTTLTGHNGARLEENEYDAFGNTLVANAASDNEILYTGRVLDQNTGLYYYRARYYDPEIGRFTMEDPIGFEAGVNFYAYVNNNPVNFNDPTGMVLGKIGSAIAKQAAKGLAKQQLKTLRNRAVADAWRLEQRLYLETGTSTIQGASRAQLDELATTGKIKGAIGHHINNVADFPDLAGNPGNIKFVLGIDAHKAEHFGNFHNSTTGELIDRSAGGKLPPIQLRSGREMGSATTDFMLTLGVASLGLAADALEVLDYFDPLTYAFHSTELAPGTMDSSLKASTNFSNSLVPTYDFGTGSYGNNAIGGGYVIYPSKANNNLMRSVYNK